MDIHASLGFLVNSIGREMFTALNARMQPYGVTAAWWAALALLWEHEGLSQNELATELKLERASVTGLLQRMEAGGVIVRRQDSEDQRVQRVYLTEHGRSLETLLVPEAEAVNTWAVRDLSPDERTFFLRLLVRVFNSVTE